MANNVQPWTEDDLDTTGTEPQSPALPTEDVSFVLPPAGQSAEDLGVSLDDLPDPAQQDTQKEEVPEVPAGFEQFSQQFKEYLGIDLTEALAHVNEVTAFRNELVIQRQKDALAQSWGVDAPTLDTRLSEVQVYFDRLPSDLQDKLDNVEGAQLIWARIEQARTSSAQSRQPQVPNFQGTQKQGVQTRINPQPTIQFKRSQILAMSPKEYAKNSKAIAEAYEQGLVEQDDFDF